MNKILVIIFVFSTINSSFSLLNDQICDAQLERFRNAIANPRENWAVESKKKKTLKVTLTDIFIITLSVRLLGKNSIWLISRPLAKLWALRRVYQVSLSNS